MTNLREDIEEILKEYRDRVTSMGEFFDSKPTDQATDQILQAFREVLPKEEEIKDEDIKSISDDKYNFLQAMDIAGKISKKLGFSSCLAQIRERIGER